MESKKVKLKSIDKKIFEVPLDILKKVKLISYLLKEAIEDDNIIFLRGINGYYLEKVLDYLNHYKDVEPKEIPKPFPEKTDEEFLKGVLNDEWTFNFLQQFSLDESIDMINSSDYLGIEGLTNITAAKLAYEMCNCDIEEARKKFGIDCDMTKEEIAKIDNYPLD